MNNLIRDKFSAIWVSYSSISDYLRCPRGYYLKNVYRDPKTNRKMTIMQPSLALGQTVHDVLEEISLLPVSDRMKFPLTEIFETKWKTKTGILGGFKNEMEESEYKQRGLDMMQRITDNPGPLVRKAIKLRQELPYYWLSDQDNLILCGKVDWLEYLEDTDSIRIIDFKTGKFDEDGDSLQLPIYYLLVSHVQNRPVSSIQYWYLLKDKEPTEVPIPDVINSEQTILEIAKRIVLARKMERFVCLNKDGCVLCRPYENVLNGLGKRVGKDGHNQDIYVMLD